MSDGPWVRFFASDWLAGTRGMTAAETGIYITLIAMMYERGGKIPNETCRLARLCGASNSSFKRALGTLIEDGKIIADGEFLTNERVVEELSYSRKKSSVARDAANRRWGQKDNKNNGPNYANALPSQCQSNANQKPDTRVEKETPIGVSKKRGSRLPDDWVPDEIFARGEGLTAYEIEREAEKFRDYWRGQAGSKGVKADWHATWRNWVRKAAGDRKHVEDDPRKRLRGFGFG